MDRGGCPGSWAPRRGCRVAHQRRGGRPARGSGPEATAWFRGGVVAYDKAVKFDLLGVRRGPVVTQRCGTEMANGVAKLLAADVAIGITGVGGPEPSEGQAAGTVIMAVNSAESGVANGSTSPVNLRT